ncbi:SNX41 [[Candida] subhashii]|uniref:SNX41 n=1 Tax=[Candida] subhashii TaxID=561895 RepID=A0A8J5QIL4_9ASCO|nr:SNX41 [[Candida] subhashii]KAG7662728.1 SNX41 [[Candida] subhashii]
MSHGNLFEDIEQDNNPSFYGNPSIINDPYGAPPINNRHSPPHSAPHASHQNTQKQGSPPSAPPSRSQVSRFHETANSGFPNELVNSTIGLSNRISELLNDDNLHIDIINSEKLMNSSVIVYTIQLSSVSLSNKIIVKRRYSEFKSLRDNLLKLYPTLIIPPIPEKHSILSYLINSINNSNEINIIEMRKRYFKLFLDDLIFDSHPKLKNCLLLHKFFDPNYELCWYNALNEPPVNLIPDNLLLANPVNPADQNGLYSLLPIVNGFDFSSQFDNLPNLKKINDDLYKLNDQVKLYELKGFEQDLQFVIPQELISFEVKFHQLIKGLNDLNKLNSKTTKTYKHLISILIDLGGNLNNFSLQVYHQNDENNTLSESIEKFGSTIDQSFLTFESFIANHLIPEWQEPIDQLIQYHHTSLNLIKFYKYKIIQFKILYKLKFNKFQQLINMSNIGGSRSTTAVNPASSSSEVTNPEEDIQQTLDHLKELNSPTVNNALKNLSIKKMKKKPSWYGLFGGNNQPKKLNFQLPVEQESNGTGTSPASPSAVNYPLKFKLNHIEKELNKLNQLIELCNNDMAALTKALVNTFEEFLVKLEKKWLVLMINYIKNGKHLFEENVLNWQEFKEFLTDGNEEIS